MEHEIIYAKPKKKKNVWMYLYLANMDRSTEKYIPNANMQCK